MTPPGGPTRLLTDRVPTPLTEHVRVTAVEPAPDGGVRVSALVTVDPDNPIFAVHYPGLPIFPGVCSIECAHWTVLAAVNHGAGRWIAAAELRGDRGLVAKINLRYRLSGGGA